MLAAAKSPVVRETHLQLNLGLGNVLLTAAAVRNLLGLGNLRPDRVDAEVLEREPLNCVDAQSRLGLHNGKPARNYRPGCKRQAPRSLCAPSRDLRKNRFVLPFSSIISTTPGFSCSIDGTWLARTPISPDSAGMLTWTASWDR